MLNTNWMAKNQLNVNSINLFYRYPDNCPPRKNAPRLGLGFGSRLELVLGLGGNQTIASKENCPWLGLGFGLGLVLGLGGNFPRGNCPRTNKNKLYYISGC